MTKSVERDKIKDLLHYKKWADQKKPEPALNATEQAIWDEGMKDKELNEHYTLDVAGAPALPPKLQPVINKGAKEPQRSFDHPIQEEDGNQRLVQKRMNDELLASMATGTASEAIVQPRASKTLITYDDIPQAIRDIAAEPITIDGQIFVRTCCYHRLNDRLNRYVIVLDEFHRENDEAAVPEPKSKRPRPNNEQDDVPEEL